MDISRVDYAPEVMNRRQAAQYLGLAYGTLRNMSSSSTGPAYSKIGGGNGRVVYRRSDLDRYLAANRITPAFGNAA